MATEELLPNKYRDKASEYLKGTDTMDVWFDSGRILSFIVTLIIFFIKAPLVMVVMVHKSMFSINLSVYVWECMHMDTMNLDSCSSF